MKDFSAVIFDMDGVIVDSEPLCAEAEQEVCRQFHLAVPLSTWDGNFTKGRTDKEFFEYIASTYGHGTVSAEQLTASKLPLYVKAMQEKLQLFPGVISFLESARSHFSHVALTTSSIAFLQQKVFEKFQLGQFFDFIVTGDQIHKGKPDPEPYLLTAQKLNLPASECIVVEDSINGVISAKKAGCFVLAITNTFSGEELQTAGADKVVDNAAELTAFLQKLRN